VTLQIIVDDKYQATYDRALVEHGPGVAEEVMTNWLKDRAKAHFDADLEAVKTDRADAATKARIKAELKL